MAKPIIAITPSCAQSSPAIVLILPDDDELLHQLCAEELIFSCGPAGDGGGCGDDAYHPARGWEALTDRLRRCGFTTGAISS